MNVENILKVAEAIETGAVEGLGFNISQPLRGEAPDYSGRGCSSAACILGWSLEVHSRELGTACLSDIFDVDDDEVIGPLIMPPGYHRSPEKYTADAAVECLRHLAKTGKVNWKRAMKLHPAPVSA